MKISAEEPLLIFLYLETAHMEKADLDALRAAGVVPVRVKRLEDVRIIASGVQRREKFDASKLEHDLHKLEQRAIELEKWLQWCLDNCDDRPEWNFGTEATKKMRALLAGEECTDASGAQAERGAKPAGRETTKR